MILSADPATTHERPVRATGSAPVALASRPWAAALLLLAPLACKDPRSSMGGQPKYTAYQSPVPPSAPEFTVERTAIPSSRPATTPDLITSGQSLFTIYCTACHGRLGNGQGIVTQHGLTPPPSFHVPRLKSAVDQHFYDVISNGYGAMVSYDDRLSPRERWAIVAYVRAFQHASDAPPSAEVAVTLLGPGDHPTTREAASASSRKTQQEGAP